MKFTNKDAKVRLYDGTTPTPYYFELCLDSGDVSAPIGISKRDEILILDRGLATACAHYITGNDMKIFDPLNVTFSAMINDSQRFLWFLDMIEGNTVNTHATVTTKDTDPRITVAGMDLSFADTTKKCFNVEYKLTGTTNSICYQINECYFNLSEQTFAEAEDGVTLSLTGMCYGTITRAADFTSGTDITA